MTRWNALVTAAVLATGVVSLQAQQVTKPTVAGVTNFNRLETTVGCAGAIKATAVPQLKKMGFASIINLRQASEQGAQPMRKGFGMVNRGEGAADQEREDQRDRQRDAGKGCCER